MTGSLNITGGSSSLTVAGTTSLNSAVNIANDLSVDSGVLFVDVSANEVGINTTSPAAPLDVRGDGGVMIRTTTNNVGAQIRFSDQTSGFSQQGRLFYQHGDASTGFGSYNEQFQIDGSETLLGFRVVGDIHASRRMGVGINRLPNFTFEVGGTGMFSGALTIDSACLLYTSDAADE